MPQHKDWMSEMLNGLENWLPSEYKTATEKA